MTALDDAADRLDAFLERLDRVGLEDLRLVALPLPEPGERAGLLADVDRIATRAGRKPLIDDARRRTRLAIERAYARHQYEPTWAGLNWGRSLGTTTDRLGLVLAAEDAAIAAVMADLLDEDTTAALGEPFERAAGMSGSTASPSLSLARPDRVGWLVWGVLLAAAILGLALNYAVGLGLAILIAAVVAATALARRAT